MLAVILPISWCDGSSRSLAGKREYITGLRLCVDMIWMWGVSPRSGRSTAIESSRMCEVGGTAGTNVLSQLGQDVVVPCERVCGQRGALRDVRED